MVDDQATLLAAAQTDAKAALETLLTGATVTVTGIRDSAAESSRRQLQQVVHSDRRRLSSHVTGNTILDYNVAYNAATNAAAAADPQSAVGTLLTAVQAQAPVSMTIGGTATTVTSASVTQVDGTSNFVATCPAQITCDAASSLKNKGGQVRLAIISH